MESELFRVLSEASKDAIARVSFLCVAVFLTCLATIGQRVAGQGFSAGQVSLSKALWNRFAGKQEPEFPRTS